MSTGLSSAGLGRQELQPGGSRTLCGISGNLETRSLASVRAHDPGAARVGDDPDPGAIGQRLVLEQGGDVEKLGQAVGPDHAGLIEEGVDGDVRRRQQGPGM